MCVCCLYGFFLSSPLFWSYFAHIDEAKHLILSPFSKMRSYFGISFQQIRLYLKDNSKLQRSCSSIKIFLSSHRISSGERFVLMRKIGHKAVYQFHKVQWKREMIRLNQAGLRKDSGKTSAERFRRCEEPTLNDLHRKRRRN